MLPSWLSESFESWHEAKVFLEHLTSIGHDALHVFAGTFFWILFAALFRRPVTSPLPLFGTLLVILFNEGVDLWVEIWPDHAMQLGEGAKDVATTMAVPLALFVVFRCFPTVLGEGKGSA